MKKKHTELLLPDTFYHVYNRGINGETVFKSEKHYGLFLEKYAYHIEPIASTFAYCLLGNHFHFLLKTRTENEILINAQIQYPGKEIDSLPHFISKQFSHLFNGYSQAINKGSSRTGNLFETPFRRIEVKHDVYFSQLVWYIHHNPQRHRFVKDFRDYPHSSYQSHLHKKATKLQRNEVLHLFGDANEYINYHNIQRDEVQIWDLMIEFD